MIIVSGMDSDMPYTPLTNPFVFIGKGGRRKSVRTSGGG